MRLELPPIKCMTTDASKSTKKMTNNTLAICEAATAMPVNPNTAAIIAKTRKVKIQDSIALSPIKLGTLSAFKF